MFRRFNHGPFPPLRDPMQTMHRHLLQAVSAGVVLLLANAAVVILLNQ